MGFAAVYLGAAKRAFDLTVEKHAAAHVDRARPTRWPTTPRSSTTSPRCASRYDAAEALLERTCADWAAGVAHADWPVRLVGTRHFVINQAFDIVDRAMDLSGACSCGRENAGCLCGLCPL